MCAHTVEFGNVYNRICAIDKIDGKYMYLDMKDPGVRDCIMDKDVETALECYKRYGRDYR